MIPKRATARPDKHLAEGEVTGHFHAATADSARVLTAGDDVFLDAPDGTEVTHQEHKTISVPPGQYRRSIVQEYNHAAEEARKVAD